MTTFDEIRKRVVLHEPVTETLQVTGDHGGEIIEMVALRASVEVDGVEYVRVHRTDSVNQLRKCVRHIVEHCATDRGDAVCAAA